MDEEPQLGDVGVGEVGVARAGNEEDGGVEPLFGLHFEVDGLPVDGAFEFLGHPAGDIGVVARAGVPGAVVLEFVEDDGVASAGQEEEGVSGADDGGAVVFPGAVAALGMEEEEGAFLVPVGLIEELEAGGEADAFDAVHVVEFVGGAEGAVEGFEAQGDVAVDLGFEADGGIEELIGDVEGGDAGEGHGVARVGVVVFDPVGPLSGGQLHGAPEAVGDAPVAGGDLDAGVGEGPHAQGAVLGVGEVADGVEGGGALGGVVEIRLGLTDLVVEVLDVILVGPILAHGVVELAVQVGQMSADAGHGALGAGLAAVEFGLGLLQVGQGAGELAFQGFEGGLVVQGAGVGNLLLDFGDASGDLVARVEEALVALVPVGVAAVAAHGVGEVEAEAFHGGGGVGLAVAEAEGRGGEGGGVGPLVVDIGEVLDDGRQVGRAVEELGIVEALADVEEGVEGDGGFAAFLVEVVDFPVVAVPGLEEELDAAIHGIDDGGVGEVFGGGVVIVIIIVVVVIVPAAAAALRREGCRSEDKGRGQGESEEDPSETSDVGGHGGLLRLVRNSARSRQGTPAH